jgi:Protein of unknown function (DUF3040)
MSLPDRQQQILDQIEKALQSADPALKSMYAMFGRLTSPEAMPATEAMPAGEGGTGEGGTGEGAAADSARAMGMAAVTGAASDSAGGPAARKPAPSWVAVGVVGPVASKAGVASTAASRRRARRALVISLIVLGLLGLMIFNVVSTSSQCPGLSSDQVVASAAVRYAACSHSTDAWSKGAR